MSGDPRLAARLRAKLRLPVMAGPMFIASTPALLVAQCKAGIVGAMPALNARSTPRLDEELAGIEHELEGCDVPYAVNLVAHRSNARLADDLAVVAAHRVPIVVLALAADPRLVEVIHAYGGLVFNDVVHARHARKCADMGVDGIIAVAAGAGGHTGSISPFALVGEIREFWQGPLLLAGCLATGRAILAAETLGADFAYIGSPFLACPEANTAPAFKQMIIEASAADIVVTKGFTGARASFLAPSLRANGLDPDEFARKDSDGVDISGEASQGKAWRDIWSAGQGVGAVKSSLPAAQYVALLARQYAEARKAMGMAPA
jgi:nitronate monooxygenase